MLHLLEPHPEITKLPVVQCRSLLAELAASTYLSILSKSFGNSQNLTLSQLLFQIGIRIFIF